MSTLRGLLFSNYIFSCFPSLRTCLKRIFSVEKDGFFDLKQSVFSLIAALLEKKPTKSNRKRRFFGLNNSL